MNIEEANKVLEEMHEVRSEMLDGRAKRLFEAIMSIADERDESNRKIKNAIEYIESRISLNLDFVKQDIIKMLKGE